MEKNVSGNIHTIVDNILCSACGGCAGICPVGAISMQENNAGYLYADIDDDKCISCGKCISICPGNGTRVRDELIGDVINGYTGYARDKEIRQQGQSGGVVTALLQWLLESKRVDAVVVSRFNCKKKRAEALLASTAQEVFEARGSHYTQTSPVEIILKNQDKKLAAVLLGCHTACLEQIKKQYPKVKLPVLTIGLICGGNLSGYVVDDLLKQAGLGKTGNISSFRFRDKSEGGWPGDIVISSEDKRVCIPKEKRMEIKPYYQSYRCMLCAEKMNQCCDIVAGDPWGINMENESDGYSAIITRTMYGNDILNTAAGEGIIVIKPEDPYKIAGGQKIETVLKRQLLDSDQVLKKYKWPAPYKTDARYMEIPYPQELDNKLKYLRELQNVKSKEEAKLLINKRKRENYHPVKEFLYNIKKRILG